MTTVATVRRLVIVPFLAVVVLVAFGAFPSAQADTLLGTGSGFLITKQGLIVTNMHVIEGASRIEVHIPSLGRAVPARVVATDKLNDLALLRVAADSVRTLGEIPYRLAAASTVAVGQDAWTLGFPLGSLMGSTARLATGTVDSLSGFRDAPGLLQISAPIQPGNSGGPLFNSQGELIGVVVSGLDAKYFFDNAGIIPQNVNFAIKVSLLRNLLESQPDWSDAVDTRPTIGSAVAAPLERRVQRATPFVVELRAFGATTVPDIPPKDSRQASPDQAADLTTVRKAAEQGDANAQSILGYAYANGRGLPQDDTQAAAWYRRAAEQGHAVAQNNLGYAYANGRGVLKDDTQAAAWYRRAAEQGLPIAQGSLGDAYSNGRGVPQDDTQAVAWYRRAAEQGHAGAQYNLGVVYADGRGVPQDSTQAVAWYRKAAEQGHANAQSSLGEAYREGLGVPQDSRQAVAWYRRAVEQGLAEGQYNLGRAYYLWQGVPQDYVEAHKWSNLAAARASTDNQKQFGAVRDMLAKVMTPAQLAEAQKRASEWLAAFEKREK